MDELRAQVVKEFRKLAVACGAKWNISEGYCDLSKNGIIVRVRWSIERIQGVLVTLREDGEDHPHEYGLYYLVGFRGGADQDMANARSGDAKLKAELVRRYAMDLLQGATKDFPAFAVYAEERVRANMPPAPTIKANKTVRPEWL